VHYIIVEPANGEVVLPGVLPVYEIGELVPTGRPEHAGVAPKLYGVEHAEEQVPALKQQIERDIRSGRPPVICAMLESTELYGPIQEQLSERLLLPKPTEGAAVFRYYDPRVFRHLRWILKAEQLGGLLGLVDSWTYLDPEEGWVTVERPKCDGATAFEVSRDQYAAIARIELVEQAIDLLRTSRMSSTADTPRQLHAQLVKGEGYGLSADDLLAFSLHGTLVSPHFDRHPRVGAVLASREETSYCDATAAWTERDWQTIARETDQEYKEVNHGA
jgi:hypothetical protein